MGIIHPFKAHKRRKLARQGFASARTRRSVLQNDTRHNGPGRRLTLLFLGVLAWSVTTATVLYHRGHSSYDYVVGQKVDRDIYSELPFEYADLEQTELMREQAARQVPLVYKVDEKTIDLALHKIAELKKVVRDAVPQDNIDDQLHPPLTLKAPAEEQSVLVRELHAKNVLQMLTPVLVDEEKVDLLARLVKTTAANGIVSTPITDTFFNDMTSDDSIYLVDLRARRVLREIKTLPTKNDAEKSILEDFTTAYPTTSETTQRGLQFLLGKILEPNITYAPEATAASRQQAANSVKAVRRFVDADTRLLRRGDIVTAEDLVRLRTHTEELQRQYQRQNAVRETIVLAVFLVGLVMAAGVGIRLFELTAFERLSTLGLVTAIGILQVLLSRVVIDVYFMVVGTSVFLVSALPLALGALLLGQLVSVRTAIWVGIFTSLVAGLQHGPSYQLFLAGAFSSFVGAMLVQGACRRHQIFRAGLGIAATAFVVNALFVISNNQPWNTLLPAAGLALANGILTAMAASAIMPLFEYIFGVTTDTSLLELSDLNHPLLRRLQLEAPGTYHHSLQVAMLAEQAATAIGANPLLARVCAYFHDIGKISQADYFTENKTLGRESPHKKLQPRMSSLVILNHVKGGLEMAAKYKLKKVIREAIAQHHGTTLVYYFYRQAIDNKANGDNGAENVGQQDYRYPGPLPVRKETVLISIADSCEAAARSLEKPTPQKIQALVDKIVMQRIQDGQLNRANLTFEELAVAKQTIAKSLTTMLHARVAYPEEKKNAEDQDHKKNGSTKTGE
ncbi:MAG: HDIG domain-containing protein [Candidatus Pacebacteria bacterium]|nr:HDIG domain-containing protein [Candidatus Paceibacterota bacterium]